MRRLGSNVLLVAAAVCFAVAFGATMGWFGSHYNAWLAGGLFFIAVAGLRDTP